MYKNSLVAYRRKYHYYNYLLVRRLHWHFEQAKKTFWLWSDVKNKLTVSFLYKNDPCVRVKAVLGRQRACTEYKNIMSCRK